MVRGNKMAKGKWSREELEFLKRNYKTTPLKEIAQVLNRKYHSVVLKASYEGLTKTPNWTTKEVEYLLQNRGILSYSEMSERLGRKSNTIAKKFSESLNRKRKPWTKLEEETLVNLYKDGQSIDVIALELLRPVNSITKKISRLGVYRRNSTYNRAVRLFNMGLTAKEASDQLEISYRQAIRHYNKWEAYKKEYN